MEETNINHSVEEGVQESKEKELVLRSGEFDGSTLGLNDDEGLNSALRIRSDVTIEGKLVEIDNIITTNFKKVSREKSLIGLTGVVGEWGVVNPIHLLKLEDEDSYMLLDGLRRVFAALRNGKKEIPAQVWYFSDIEEGKEMANVLSLMINRSQRFSAKEMWEQMQILEEVNNASPGLVEFLLQMQSGDSMKLRDVMCSDIEYADIRNDLMEGILTIDAAYRKLTNERKKENRLAKEDALVLGTESVTTNIDEVSDEQQLSVDDVKDLLDLSETDVMGDSLEDLDRSDEVIDEPVVQDPKNRRPLDPELRKAVLERDNYRCQCCGVGGENYASVLAVHHIIPVFLGGPDELCNLNVQCLNHHVLIHDYSMGRGNIKLDNLTDEEKEIFKKVFKYGNIIIEASKRLGMKSDQVKKLSKDSSKHPMPGKLYKENIDLMRGVDKDNKEG